MSNFEDEFSFDSEPEESEEVKRLKPVYARLSMEMVRINEEITDPAEKRAALEKLYKGFMRASFFTDPLATEEDFERLYPRLRDDRLCENAEIVYRQVFDRLTEEFNKGKSPEDYLEGDSPESKE